MTNGIGNPDWQRRYVFSAVPLLVEAYNDGINQVSGLVDANGFQYLLITTASPSGAIFSHVKVDWFQDANASLQMGDTDYTIPPNTFIVIKVPVVTRYFKLEIGPVGGTSGHTITATVYGTNADQPDMLTENTSVPMAAINATLAAGATQTVVVSGIMGGRVMTTWNHGTNANWIGFIEYYDWTTQTWIIFYNVRGSDKGESWAEPIWLPYAPVRLNMRNTDTASQVCQAYMIAANTP